MNLSPLPVQKFFDNDGAPLVGGLLYTYVVGTTTKIATYKDQAGTLNTNPVVLDYRGEANVWLDQTLVYKFVLAPRGDTDPPTKPIWTVDNISASVTYASLTQQILGQIIYPRTPEEVVAAVTPTFYIYTPKPRIDPRRYGVIGDGVTNDTTAMQTAINMAYAQRGMIVVPHDFTILSGALSLTLTGNRLTNSLVIEGSGMNGSAIKQTGAPGSLLTFQSSTPTIVHTEAQLVLAGLSIVGVGKTAHGVSLKGIAGFRIDGCQITGFDRALDLQSALVGLIEGDTRLVDSNTGVRMRKSGTAASCNLITIRDAQIKFNSTWGIDFNQGSQLKVERTDIEQNGTAANVNTGGALLGDTIEAETGFGLGLTSFDSCWFESNKGRTLSVAAQAGGIKHFLSINDTGIYSPEATRALFVAGCENISLRNVAAPGPTDTLDITASTADIQDCFIGVLTDTGITYPTYINVQTAAVVELNGRIRNYTGTLTQCTTAPTGTIQTIQQGKSVTIFLDSALTAASANVNAPRITGMPAGIIPGSTKSLTGWNTDNSADKISQIQILNTGDISLANGATGAFTAAGVKGCQYFRGTYEIP